ncbi:MAG: energy-coupling factor transporter ATPase [bacterium]|nr:energy-coupling factor transporter ATPase [bacterium]
MSDSIIECDHVSYWYGLKTPSPVQALEEVSLSIEAGQRIGVVGHTGSGKSTFVQLLNALLLPTNGVVKVFGEDTSSKTTDLKALRKRVGLVFQFPEHQLFEETVWQDVAFGPRQMALDEKEVSRRAERALADMGLDTEKIVDRSPFELSGGQQRRVAIAGVLAMEPEILILDEPLAGLDPEGKRSFEARICELHAGRQITTIIVSHELESIARLCDKVIVFEAGRVREFEKTRRIFEHVDMIRDSGLELPEVNQLMETLKKRGLKVRADVLTVEEAAREIIAALKD